MYLIGLTGYKKSGKDEVVKILQKHLYPRSVLRIAFADALKEEVAQATGKELKYIEEHKDNFRLILQGWGTDFRRSLCSEDYWIEKWLRKINHIPDDTYCVLVPDVRFPNEAKIITDIGGTIWKVERPDIVSDGHESEEHIDKISYSKLIYNSSDLENLRIKTVSAWNSLYAYTGKNTNA